VKTAIEVTSLVLVGLIAGAELGSWCCVQPVVAQLLRVCVCAPHDTVSYSAPVTMDTTSPTCSGSLIRAAPEKPGIDISGTNGDQWHDHRVN
jgi:hypothetical protein